MCVVTRKIRCRYTYQHINTCMHAYTRKQLNILTLIRVVCVLPAAVLAQRNISRGLFEASIIRYIGKAMQGKRRGRRYRRLIHAKIKSSTSTTGPNRQKKKHRYSKHLPKSTSIAGTKARHQNTNTTMASKEKQDLHE